MVVSIRRRTTASIMLKSFFNRRENQMYQDLKDGSHWNSALDGNSGIQKRDGIFTGPFTLALGGGGARGLAHIGVLRAFESKGIFPSLIVGSSMGAIIGAMYSQLRDSSRVEKLVKELLHRDCFADLRLDLMPENSQDEAHRPKRRLVDYLKRGIYLSRVARHSGAIDSSLLIHFLSRLLKDEDIRETNIPFAAVAVNLATGEEVVLDSGSIIRAVAASSAIPGVITPVEIDGEQLIDGSVLQVVPVSVARQLSPYPVVAVDVSRNIAREPLPKTGLDVMIRADLIANRRLNKHALKAADVVFTPDVGLADWSDFHSVDMLVAAGIDAARPLLQKVSSILAPLPLETKSVKRRVSRYLTDTQSADRHHAGSDNRSIFQTHF
jgi:NTE family protein